MTQPNDPTFSEASACSEAGTCAEWAPDCQRCVQPLGVRGRLAVNQTRQVECRPAAPLVAFPDTSLSHDDLSLACCFCHLVISMACLRSQWLCMWRACPRSFFSQDKLNFTSSGLIKPFVSKIVTQPLWELNLTPPSLHPLKVTGTIMERGEDAHPPHPPQSAMT